MANISVPYNSDQTPNFYQAPQFILGEAPTSAKLNLFGSYINTQFGILSEAIGNPFVYGQPSIAGAIGSLNLLTPGAYNSNSLIALAGPQYNGTNQTNELAATINSSITSFGYQITLTSGVIGSQNIVQIGSSYYLINAAIVTKNGSGFIDKVFPGTFNIPGYPGSGSINTFYASFGDVPPVGPIYVEVVNTSVTQQINQLSINQGNQLYGRTLGYTTSSDSISTLNYTIGTAGPTQTAEINSIENKSFLVQWHAAVTKSTATTSDATNYYWYTTASTSAFQGGSSPTAAQAIAFVATNQITLPSSANSLAFCSSNALPICTSAGALTAMSVTYSGGNLILSIPISNLINIPNTQAIDIYFPVLIPYRMLQTMNLNYSDINMRIEDLFLNAIGYQYGWSGGSQPATIATRLNNDEAQIINIASQTIQFNSLRAYGGGSVNFTTAYNGWMEIIIGGGGGAGGGGDSNAGGNQGPGTAGGGGGGTGQVAKIYAYVQQGWSINGSPGSGGGSFGANGNSTTLNIGPYQIICGGGAGGAGGQANAGFGGGAGGAGSQSLSINLPTYVIADSGGSNGTYGMSFMNANSQQRAPGGVGGFSGICGGQLSSGGNGGNGGEPAAGAGQNTSWTAGKNGYIYVRY